MQDVELTPIQADDLELIRNWRNSNEVAQYMYTADVISEEQQKRWFEKISSDSSVLYWIISFGGQKVGLVSIVDISQVYDSCSWAFYLGDTSIRGAGIGSKVEYKVLHYVFEELGLNKLRCEVFTFNEKVISMHEKFGFRREGYYRQHVLKNGAYHDVIGLALLKKEWQALKKHAHELAYKN